MKDVNGSPPGPRAAPQGVPDVDAQFHDPPALLRVRLVRLYVGMVPPLDGAADIDGDDPHTGGLAAFVDDEVAPELEQKGRRRRRGRDRYHELGAVLLHKRFHGPGR